MEKIRGKESCGGLPFWRRPAPILLFPHVFISSVLAFLHIHLDHLHFLLSPGGHRICELVARISFPRKELFECGWVGYPERGRILDSNLKAAPYSPFHAKGKEQAYGMKQIFLLTS